jgi:hypothetical protein
MLVRAVKRGFFGGVYRRQGDEFNCPSDRVSSVWMEEVKKGDKTIEKEPETYVPLEIPSLMNKPKRKAKAKPSKK